MSISEDYVFDPTLAGLIDSDKDFAVIDIGSNKVKLFIYKFDGQGGAIKS
jgi:hypothetical protein